MPETPEETQAKKLLAEGQSVAKVATATGLSTYRVWKLKHPEGKAKK